MFFNGFSLVLEVDEVALELVPHGEVIDVVEAHEGVEGKDENLEVYEGR